jgi:hypothetical protein
MNPIADATARFGGIATRVINRIQNPDAPFTRRRIDRRNILRIEPNQTLLSQLPQAVIIGDRLSQLPNGAIDCSVKAASPIVLQETERNFDVRDPVWLDCQDINQIDQDLYQYHRTMLLRAPPANISSGPMFIELLTFSPHFSAGRCVNRASDFCIDNQSTLARRSQV